MEGSAEEGNSSSPGITGPADGHFDFSLYTLEQLEQLIFSFDRVNQPENFTLLLAALQSRRATTMTGPQHPAGGRFTRRGGPIGWLQAVLGRSPVYGPGCITPADGRLFLDAPRTAWFGRSLESRLEISAADVQDVTLSEDRVEFGIRRRLLPAWRIRYQVDSSNELRALSDALHAAETASPAGPRTALKAFNQQLNDVSGRPFVVLVVIALNLLVFAAMVVGNRGSWFFPQPLLIAWGANYAPLSLGPQPYRLLYAPFLHIGLLHLVCNMLALWYVGRLSERVLGRWVFLGIYLSCALFASLTSCIWDPSTSSVGASGAIFGIYGAFLGYLMRRRLEIPARVLNPLWISAAAFCLFNLIGGVFNPIIDNAAHVGGLLCGLALGSFWARPLQRAARVRLPRNAVAGSLAFAATAMIFFGWEISRIGSFATSPDRQLLLRAEYREGETANLQLWDNLSQQSSRGVISDAEFAERFEKDVLPFWQAQAEKLHRESAKEGPSQMLTGLLAQYAQTREQMAKLIVRAAKSSDENRFEGLDKLGAESAAVKAKVDWLSTRSLMDASARSLSGSAPVMKLRALFAATHCVASPYVTPTVASDRPTDAPALRAATACESQRLFLTGQYAQLQARLDQALKSQHDLPDGSSSYEALTGGLALLFKFNPRLSIHTMLLQTALWRQSASNVTWANLVEVMVWDGWAWQARGSGLANSVSSQNMALFSYRNLLAAAALDNCAAQAVKNPEWYGLSLDVGLARGLSKQELRGIYDRGGQYDTESALRYRNMMRALMPRWGGSYDEIKAFIERERHMAGMTEADARYAELYTLYAWLEGDDANVFEEAGINWDQMKGGYRDLLKAHPDSDIVLNRFAEMACRAGDHTQYDNLRAILVNRSSASAWSPKYSRAACDDGSAMPATMAAGTVATPLEPVLSLNGIALGMTRDELRRAKGAPERQTTDEWMYHSGKRQDGVITVRFAVGAAGGVSQILYEGGSESAPSELSYYADLSSVQLLQRLGKQDSGQLVLRGPMTFTFPNGIYAETVDEKVTRYGIYAVSGKPAERAN